MAVTGVACCGHLHIAPEELRVYCHRHRPHPNDDEHLGKLRAAVMAVQVLGIPYLEEPVKRSISNRVLASLNEPHLHGHVRAEDERSPQIP